jgi:hypothetical protein
VYGAGMEDVRADDAVEAGSSWTSHLPLTSGGKLLDFVSVESSNNNHKSRRASAGAKGGRGLHSSTSPLDPNHHCQNIHPEDP